MNRVPGLSRGVVYVILRLADRSIWPKKILSLATLVFTAVVTCTVIFVMSFITSKTDDNDEIYHFFDYYTRKVLNA